MAAQLTATLDTDIEKARVFYMWLVKNVRYDCKKFHNRKSPDIKAVSKKDYDQKLALYREKQLEKTIKRKKGICDDYSRLFKSLCDEVGVESEIIIGVARDHGRPFRKVHKNSHAWNAIKLEGKWHLLDATWGAGYTNAKVTKFSRRVTSSFFLTAPTLFAQNHLPNDEKWQLLESPISKKEFPNQPILDYASEKYKIEAFSNDVLQVKGDSNLKQIWIEFETAPKEFRILSKTGKKIPFSKTENEGMVVLSISGSVRQNIFIYAGEKLMGKMDRIGGYKL